MPPRPRKPFSLSAEQARRIWLHAQRLDRRAPFGAGPEATRAAVEHLGYVQIDTINVIERCHHHILYARIPGYRRSDLAQAQSVEKSVFEYWTHALSYVPARDIRYFLPEMKAHREEPKRWSAVGAREETRKLLRRIRRDGALTIRDIEEELIEKAHLWASKKPSKGLLERAFYDGDLVISARNGMVKTYELFDRHFQWEKRPAPASERQVAGYKLDRALRAQGLVSLDSACHLDAPGKKAVAAQIAGRVRRKELVPVAITGAGKQLHWAMPGMLEAVPEPEPELIHILSPFDPLVIQRKRAKLFFDYAHVFEAYLRPENRVYGYFGLPVLAGDRIVAVLDLKTDRAAGKLLMQRWTWLDGFESPGLQAAIEEELARFERFQLGRDEAEPARAEPDTKMPA
ncbi:MAG: YcaQ family DNA glycosylase [Bosea sp.]|uniref:winged helix-turn-helix domain-containing protein n=1 Tax=unclassified Bosea (in: a-proteobacteria) TaxID=2653178 RepID=UPI0009645B03|nr:MULTISPECIES: crosslink repair DNA glycosylase YcaQ family protein [unclassified Bosea (in: a-proteobacteria)]MBN9455654.1 YcaQ family DNA glycosylase [Bosea sp. (in: a-proteobacteria)]OJV05228.1 MAG: cytoplasmic protein [Bosea sp. 67-29]